MEYLPNVERGVDTSGILVLDYGHFKAVAIGAKDCSAEIRSTIQGDKGAITIFGATNTLPEIGVTLNGQKERTVNLNSPQHRMYDEFVAFEKMVATKDLTVLPSSWNIVVRLWKFWIKLRKLCNIPKKQAVVLAIACFVLYSCWE